MYCHLQRLLVTRCENSCRLRDVLQEAISVINRLDAIDLKALALATVAGSIHDFGTIPHPQNPMPTPLRLTAVALLAFGGLHVSADDDFETIQARPTIGFAPPTVGKPVGKPKQETKTDVEISIAVTEPVKIDPKAAQQLKAHKEFLDANADWEANADKLMQQLNDQKSGTAQERLKSHRGYRNLTQYPEAVTSKLPKRPEYAAPPEGSDIKWQLKFKNTGDKPATVNESLGCDFAWLKIKVTPSKANPAGAFQVKYGPRITTMEIRAGKQVELAAGESKTIQVSGFGYGARFLGGTWAIVQPGDYTLTATYCSRGTGMNGISGDAKFKAVE
ncbi:MAG: hypothetical protein CBB71_23745 [Rhodopirellula sp. TMED11]|nr:MAG: hypothetical protein CBB71_23745 [Rhodopirellula sp. TMED11]